MGRRGLVVACGASVFLSAFLLFAVQPFAARLILPEFGGSPAVWTTSLVFFQVSLLGGYAYTHLGVLRASPRRAYVVHVVLLLAALPLLPPHGPQAVAGSPVASLLVALTVTVGLPFLALSTHALLVQRWFALAGGSRDPYVLYAASNAGSLLALLAYPLLVEPRLGLATQGRLFAVGYALFAGSAAWIGWAAIRREGVTVEMDRGAPPLPWARRLRWMGLSATGSALLLGATLRITTDVASVPLLWVLPLALYLVTFIVAFGRGVPFERSTFRILLMAAIACAVGTLLLQRTGPALVLITVHLAAMKGGCLLCHGELAADRPEPRHLTSFYLWLAVGGAAGGVLSQLVLPLLFDDILEYPLALLAVLVWLSRGAAREGVGVDRRAALAAAVVFAGVGVAVRAGPGVAELALHAPILVMLVALASSKRDRRFPAVAAVSVALLLTGLHVSGDIVWRERGFYGVVTVADRGGVREMLHGALLHGEEAADRPGRPRSYYEPGSPMARLTAAVPADGRVCLVGMGAASLSTLGKPGQRMTWFEVDPVVARAARDHFTFLRDAPGEVDVVLGDARKTLAADPGGCDLLLSDAFSGDVVPVHLLTVEALQVYRAALSGRGVLAFHASSRHFDLNPVFRGLAASAGLDAWIQVDLPDAGRRALGAVGSRVVVLAAPSAGPPGPGWDPLGLQPAVHWSDDRASLVDVWVPMRDLQHLGSR